ncbi:MAG: T9SS type A sorting domain-containing protein [Bacteroidia bacterium]
MKTYYLTILFFLIFIADDVKAQALSWEWAKGIGGIGGGYANSMTIDLFDDTYTTGYLYGTCDFDPGSGVLNLTTNGYNDIFISKLDGSGNLVWAKIIGGIIQDMGSAITVDTAGSIYLTGFFGDTVDFNPGPDTFNLISIADQDMFISKLDSAGNFMWARQINSSIGHAGASPLSITLDNSGNIYITGTFEGTVDFDPDSVGVFNLTSDWGGDIFIAKYSSIGSLLWVQKTGNNYPDIGLSIFVDLTGNVYSTGSFSGTVDFDPDSLANFYLTSSGGTNAFISKLDSSGNFVWAKKLSANPGSYCEGHSIKIDEFDNMNVAGYFQGTVDFDPDSVANYYLTSPGSQNAFICKLNQAGNFVWAKQITGTYSIASSLIVDSSNNIYFTGIYEGLVDLDPDSTGIYNLTSVGQDDVFICKLDSGGNFIWGKSIGGTNWDNCNSIALNSSGSVYLAGYFFSPSMSFDSLILANSDSTGNSANIFIAKLGAINTGIETTAANNNLYIYPNPATNILNISLPNHLPPNSFITINDMQGRVIKEEKISQNNSTIQVDVSALTQGVYLLRINGQVQRFVKM